MMRKKNTIDDATTDLYFKHPDQQFCMFIKLGRIHIIMHYTTNVKTKQKVYYYCYFVGFVLVDLI